jgi:tetratricopeptide (TPR) repeat protein
MAKKVTRHDLKKPDEFISFGTRAIEYVQQNAKVVAAAAAVVLLVSVAAIALVQMTTGKADEAAFRYGQVSDELRQASALHGEERTEKLSEALKKLEEIYETYPGTRSADYALLQIGQANFELRKYEQAANAFETASKRFDEQPNFKAMALQGAGKSHEAMRNYNKALDFYQRTNAVEGNPYQEVLKADIGRIKVYQEQADAAKAALNSATESTGK